MFGVSIAQKSKFFFAAGVLLLIAVIFAGCSLLPVVNSSQAMAISSPIAGSHSDLQTSVEPAVTASPLPSPTPIPSNTITSTDIPTTTSNYSEGTIAGYSIIIHNPYSVEAHIFINNEYALTVPPGSSGTLSGIQSGTHTLHYCQAVDQLECAPPETIEINANAEWQIPEISEDVSVKLLASPTPQSETALSPTANATPTLLPTARVMRGTFYTLKINNPNRWMIFVFMDDELFLKIPKRKYRTFSSLSAGTYAFEYCWNKKHKLCFRTVEVTINSDTEIWAHP